MSQSQIRGNDLGQVIEHFFLKFNFLIYKIKMAIGCVLGFAREASVRGVVRSHGGNGGTWWYREFLGDVLWGERARLELRLKSCPGKLTKGKPREFNSPDVIGWGTMRQFWVCQSAKN